MLDFKDWKKTKEDGKSVTMQHPKGHEMVILLKGVPSIQKEALKRLPLADGGQVKGVHKTSMPDDEGGKWAGESKAGEHLRNSDIRPSSKEKAKDEHNRVLGEMKSMPQPKLKGLAHGGVASYDDGTPNAPVSSDDAKTPPPVVVNVGQPASAAATQASTPVNVPNPNVQTTNPNVLLPNGSMSAPGAAQTFQESAEGQQRIDTAKAQAMVPVEQARLQAERQQAQQDQDRINALSTHADNLAANIKSINPNAAWDNMSEPKKVSTALGLFLGGMSVPFHGTNFAQDTLNKALDRDVQAQIKNNENQQTIFGAYNQLYGNQVVAAKMARASMADIYADQVSQISAKLGTPQAFVNGQKLKAGLAIEKNKAIQEAAGNVSSIPNNPSGRGGPGSSPQLTGQPDQPQTQPQGEDTQGNSAPSASQTQPEGVLSQFIHGRLGSSPAAEAMTNPSEGKSSAPKNPIYSILKPNANAILHSNVQYGAPKAREDYTATKEQYDKARQAEKVLNGVKGDGVGGIHDLMQNMYTNSGSGGAIAGLGPHIRNSTAGALGSIPEVGPALEGLTHIIPRSGAQKEFDSNKTVMETDLANALQGLVAPTDINKIVEANLPAYRDTPKDIERKTQAIVNMVIKGLKGGLIENYGMIK